MTAGPAASGRALRAWLDALPPGAREEALRGLLRAEAAHGAVPGKAVLALVASHPDLLRAAAEALLDDAATRAFAGAILVRLTERHGSHAARRALILARLRDRPEARWGERTELLRTELLDPSPEAERAEIWRIGMEGLPATTRASYAAQRAVAAGTRPHGGELLARLAAAREEALAQAPPRALRILAGAGSVALVGNGSLLAGSGAATRIEAHDCVVRINYPPVAAFATDVGTRTDVMLLRDPSAERWAALKAREPGHAAVPALVVHGAGREVQPGEPPRLPPALAIEVGRIAYRRLTTGFWAILLIALALQRRATLFGFDLFRPGSAAHYFGGGGAAPAHEPEYERWFVARVLPALCPDLVSLDPTSAV
jgi:hypothetical protein